MKLTIAITSWNKKELLRNCLKSIFEQKDVEKEVIVVENASSDGTAEMIKKDFPKVKLIQNKTNRGVSGGKNQGLKAAKGEYILILDQDTLIKNNSLKKMVDFMDKNQEVGVCGAKLIYADKRIQYSCGNFFTLKTKFFRRFNFGKKLIEKEMYMNWDHNNARRVGYVIGACQMIRRKAMQEIGFMDEKTFPYCVDDVDYCMRMWKKDWEVAYYPETVIIHFEQRLSRKSLLNKKWKINKTPTKV